MKSRMALSSLNLLPGTLNVLQVIPWMILDTLLMRIWTLNFQGIILGVNQGNPWHQGWPCPPSLLSEALNILQVPPWWTTPSLNILQKKISTWNFHSIFLGVKEGHPWYHDWPWPSSLLSGTIIVLKVHTLRKESSLYTYNWTWDLKHTLHD